MPRGREISQQLRDIIIQNLKDGKSSYKCAKELAISPNTVQKIYKKYKTAKINKILPRTGRKKILSPRDRRTLQRIVQENRRQTTSDVTKKLSEATNKRISNTTVWRELKDQGYGFYKVNNQ